MTNSTRSRRIVDQITTATDKRFELVARMADFIVKTTLETSDCTQQDILARGFAQQDVFTLWHFANALAAVELRCKEKDFASPFAKEVRYA